MGIFDEQISRKPDKYPWTGDFIDAMHNGFWTHREFSFSSDTQDFLIRMNDQERAIIVKTLSAIGQIEIAVKTFWAKLGDNLPHPSILDMGLTMAHTEIIHNRAYERLLDVLGINEVFEENLKLECMGNRVKYLKKYTHRYYKDSKKQYIYAIILFTLFVENVSLFSQFYIILWFGRYKNYLKDTNQQILYTKNEEDLHSKIGIKIINTIKSEYPELFDEDLINRIRSESHEAFLAESKIIDWILGDYKDSRISATVLKDYIKYKINQSMDGCGFEKPYEIPDSSIRDFEWMNEEVTGNNMVDFFNQKSVDYSKNIIIDEDDLI
jgi:ribonucleoside-diphosphate reductase beta chain